MFGIPFIELAEVGLFVWVIDKNGNRKKVKVKNEAEKQKLLAHNRKMREQLKSKKTVSKVKKTVKRKKKNSDWDW
jgi:hypothetical protein